MSAVFDPDYATLPGFIIGITERIWEGRDLGLIRRTYAPEIVMHTTAGDSSGVEAVVAGTFATLHAFPDRLLLPEDVIWSGGASGVGFSSHRIASTMHHRGDGLFGPPTGKPVLVRTVADCLMRPGAGGEARIVEEWLVRDQSAIALQLGLDPRELGARLAAGRGGPSPSRPAAMAAPEPQAVDPAIVANAHSGAGEACAAAFARIWNEADLSAIRGHYAPGVTLHLPGGRVAAGQAAMDGFVIGLLASFPDARASLDQVTVRADPGRAIRVALRWRLAGTHAGHGAFGAPSGAPVALLGITHSEMVEGRVAQEYVMLDELAVWTAIAAARG